MNLEFICKAPSLFSPGGPRLHRLHWIAVPVPRLRPASVQVRRNYSDNDEQCLTYDSYNQSAGVSEMAQIKSYFPTFM